MIYYIAKQLGPKEHSIIGYFEDMPSLEKALEENKDTLDLNGQGRIFQVEPGIYSKRELVRNIE
jgi:hypothetical protein